jgi:hypothetical protein
MAKAATKPKKPVKPVKKLPPAAAKQKLRHAFISNSRVHVIRSRTPVPSKPVKAIQPDYPDLKFPGKSYWSLGHNDELETCAMTALANHLLISKRSKADDDDIAAAGENLSLKDAVAYAESFGLAGWGIKDAYQIELNAQALTAPGVLFALDTEWGPHAVVTVGGGLCISWGRIMRIKPPMKITEAWFCDWSRESPRTWDYPVG